MKRCQNLVCPILCAAFFVCFFSGCAPQIKMSVSNKDSPIQIAFSTELGSTLETTFKSFSGLPDGEPLFSAPVITRALCDSGFTRVVSHEKGFAGFDVSCFAPAADGKDAVIPLAITSDAGAQQMTLVLRPESIRSIAAALPEDVRGYTDLFMAPLLLNEAMSPEEYGDLIAAAYGATLAAELKTAVMRFTVNVPGTPVAGQAVFFDKKYEAEVHKKSLQFVIPVSVFLCETKDITITARWR